MDFAGGAVFFGCPACGKAVCAGDGKGRGACSGGNDGRGSGHCFYDGDLPCFLLRYGGAKRELLL